MPFWFTSWLSWPEVGYKGHVSSPLYQWRPTLQTYLPDVFPSFCLSDKFHLYLSLHVFRVLKSGTEETSRPKGSERAAIAGEGTANIGGKTPASKQRQQILSSKSKEGPTFLRRYTECSVGKKNGAFLVTFRVGARAGPLKNSLSNLVVTRYPVLDLMKDLPLGPVGIWSSVPT